MQSVEEYKSKPLDKATEEEFPLDAQLRRLEEVRRSLVIARPAPQPTRWQLFRAFLRSWA